MKRYRIKSFVRKHDRHLVILASFLAIGTLMLREIVKEQLKDARDSLAQAETTLRVMHEFKLVERELHEIIQMVDEKNRPKKPSDNTPLDSQVLSLERDFDSGLAELTKDTDEIADVFEAALLRPVRKKEMDEIYKQINSLKSDRDDESKMKGSDKDKLEAIQENMPDLRAAQIELMYITDYVVDGARIIERKRDGQYKVVTYLSYVLLLMAATMGLLGRILNVRGVDAPD